MDGTATRMHLFYDRDCPLCRRLRDAVARLDRSGCVALVDLQGPEARALLDPTQHAAARERLTVRDGRGQLHSGADALRLLCQTLPALRGLAWAFRLPGVTPAVGHLYRAVASRRKGLCLQCGQRWMPSKKWSRRHRPGR